MLDEELKKEIAVTLPKEIPHLFISSVANIQLDKLKDLLWNSLVS
jgi:GTP-binding protein